MDEWIEREKLHRAAEAGGLTLVCELLNQGCPVNAFDELGKTPLHYAVLGEHFTVVDVLLRSGADVNAHDEQRIGNTPLGEAASTCSLRMARLLVEAGADPTIPGWMQRSALDRAERRRHEEGTGSEGQAVFNILKEAARKRARVARRFRGK
ncbi:MAG TPA: ankyrin repeat domain-containing protein [Gemmataceae bacterium]|jgi:ankyrin repeat protein